MKTHTTIMAVQGVKHYQPINLAQAAPAGLSTHARYKSFEIQPQNSNQRLQGQQRVGEAKKGQSAQKGAPKKLTNDKQVAAGINKSRGTKLKPQSPPRVIRKIKLPQDYADDIVHPQALSPTSAMKNPATSHGQYIKADMSHTYIVNDMSVSGGGGSSFIHGGSMNDYHQHHHTHLAQQSTINIVNTQQQHKTPSMDRLLFLADQPYPLQGFTQSTGSQSTGNVGPHILRREHAIGGGIGAEIQGNKAVIKIEDLYKLKDLIERLSQNQVLGLQDAAMNFEYEVVSDNHQSDQKVMIAPKPVKIAGSQQRDIETDFLTGFCCRGDSAGAYQSTYYFESPKNLDGTKKLGNPESSSCLYTANEPFTPIDQAKNDKLMSQWHHQLLEVENASQLNLPQDVMQPQLKLGTPMQCLPCSLGHDSSILVETTGNNSSDHSMIEIENNSHIRLRNCPRPAEVKEPVTDSGITGPDDVIVDIDQERLVRMINEQLNDNPRSVNPFLDAQETLRSRLTHVSQEVHPLHIPRTSPVDVPVTRRTLKSSHRPKLSQDSGSSLVDQVPQILTVRQSEKPQIMVLSRESTPIDLGQGINSDLQLSERQARPLYPHSQFPHSLIQRSCSRHRAQSEERKIETLPQGLRLSQLDGEEDGNLSVCINESDEGEQDSNMKAVLEAIMQAQFNKEAPPATTQKVEELADQIQLPKSQSRSLSRQSLLQRTSKKQDGGDAQSLKDLMSMELKAFQESTDTLNVFVEQKIKESSSRTPTQPQMPSNSIHSKAKSSSLMIESLKPDEDDEYVSINYVAPQAQEEEEKLQFIASSDMDFRDFLTKNAYKDRHFHSSEDLPSYLQGQIQNEGLQKVQTLNHMGTPGFYTDTIQNPDEMYLSSASLTSRLPTIQENQEETSKSRSGVSNNNFGYSNQTLLQDDCSVQDLGSHLRLAQIEVRTGGDSAHYEHPRSLHDQSSSQSQILQFQNSPRFIDSAKFNQDLQHHSSGPYNPIKDNISPQVTSMIEKIHLPPRHKLQNAQQSRADPQIENMHTFAEDCSGQPSSSNTSAAAVVSSLNFKIDQFVNNHSTSSENPSSSRVVNHQRNQVPIDQLPSFKNLQVVNAPPNTDIFHGGKPNSPVKTQRHEPFSSSPSQATKRVSNGGGIKVYQRSSASKSARVLLGTDVNKLSLTDLLLLEGQVIRKKVVIFDDNKKQSSRRSGGGGGSSGSRSRSPPENVAKKRVIMGGLKQAINDKIQKRGSVFARKAQAEGPISKRSKSREEIKGKDETMKILIDVSKKATQGGSRSGRRNNNVNALHTERGPSPSVKEPMFIMNHASARDRSPPQQEGRMLAQQTSMIRQFMTQRSQERQKVQSVNKSVDSHKLKANSHHTASVHNSARQTAASVQQPSILHKAQESKPKSRASSKPSKPHFITKHMDPTPHPSTTVTKPPSQPTLASHFRRQTIKTHTYQQLVSTQRQRDEVRLSTLIQQPPVASARGHTSGVSSQRVSMQ